MPENTSNDTHVSGGNIVAGNIGGSGNSATFHGSVSQSASTDSETLAAALKQLRAELSALRSALPATDGPEAQPDEVGELVEELDRPEPDVARVATKWERLVRRIPEPLRSLDSIAKIVALIGQVRGLSA